MLYYIHGRNGTRAGRAKLHLNGATVYEVPTDFPVELAGAITADFQDLVTCGVAKHVCDDGKVFNVHEAKLQAQSIHMSEIPPIAKRYNAKQKG